MAFFKPSPSLFIMSSVIALICGYIIALLMNSSAMCGWDDTRVLANDNNLESTSPYEGDALICSTSCNLCRSPEGWISVSVSCFCLLLLNCLISCFQSNDAGECFEGGENVGCELVFASSLSMYFNSSASSAASTSSGR